MGRAGGSERVDKQVKGTGNGFQLKSDVRHDAKHSEDRDDCTKGRRLAVTAGDKVRDTYDVLLFADPDYFAKQEPPGEGNQGRAEIDGKEVDPGRCCTANAAVKCPGCAINRQRKRVDCGVVNYASATFSLVVCVKGDTKKHSKIEQGGQDDQRDRDHGVSSSEPLCWSLLELS